MLLKLCRFAVTTDAVVWIEICQPLDLPYRAHVTTDAVVWIEISAFCELFMTTSVTTDAVVWIEINSSAEYNAGSTSSPLMQWCGLKFCLPA